MPVFNIIEAMEKPTEEMRGDVIVKKVAKKDISKDADKEDGRKFIPVFMDNMNR